MMAAAVVDAQTVMELSAEDARSFMRDEETIRQGLKTFVNVGEALMRIQEKQWYITRGYQTFQEYCSQEWGLSGRTLQGMTSAAQQVRELAVHLPDKAHKPTTKAQTDALRVAGDAQAQATAWDAAQRATGTGQPSSKAVKAEAIKVSGAVQLSIPDDFPSLPLAFSGPVFMAPVILRGDSYLFEIVPASPTALQAVCTAYVSTQATGKVKLGQHPSFASAQQACGDWLALDAQKKGIIR